MKRADYDYSKLRVLILRIYGTYTAFAKALGIRPATLSLRLTNKSHWPQPDIDVACELLEIENPKGYFFVHKV